MPSLRVLIVDDEPVARQVLRELLDEMRVTVAGEAATGLEAVEQVARLKPDIALVDLQMPGLDGFGVARALRGERPPLLIFVTAFDKHALQAFESGAVDYLLKPVRRERLAAALEKAGAQLAGLRPAPPPREPLLKVVGRVGSDLHLLDPDQIVAFLAEGDSVRIVASNGGRYLADKSMKELDARLPRERFRRIHRSTIINVDHISKISPLSSKRWLLKLSNGMEAVVSKRLAGVIREATRW
ncbi:MAG: response regulator transcription factor [Bryobacterales bacterium]|nr:response regulator transcription factor [Bryobacterales bacterium]